MWVCAGGAYLDASVEMAMVTAQWNGRGLLAKGNPVHNSIDKIIIMIRKPYETDLRKSSLLECEIEFR